MGWLFHVLFKYPRVVFEQGHFTFALSRSLTLALAAAALLGFGALVTYRGAWSAERPRDRAVLIGLRVAIVAALIFCLARPILVLKAAVPQQNFLGILLDDSRSMTIADKDGQPRTEFVQQQLALPDSALLNALSQRFVLRFFRFSSSADRVASAADLKYVGTASRLGPAARARARRARRAAARRPRDGERRRRHLRRHARRRAREPQGAADSRVHGRRGTGALRARHPGHAGRDAAIDPQRHDPVGGRRRHADRIRRRDRAAQRRGSGTARQLAADHAAARRRIRDGARQLHRGRPPARACSASPFPRRTRNR